MRLRTITGRPSRAQSATSGRSAEAGMASEHRVPRSRLRPQQIMSTQHHRLCPVASAMTRFATTAAMSPALALRPQLIAGISRRGVPQRLLELLIERLLRVPDFCDGAHLEQVVEAWREDGRRLRELLQLVLRAAS